VAVGLRVRGESAGGGEGGGEGAGGGEGGGEGAGGGEGGGEGEGLAWVAVRVRGWGEGWVRVRSK